MKSVLIIGKFPPIQGGVARDVFHIAAALASRFDVVHVVTNAEECDPAFKIHVGCSEIEVAKRIPDNVAVHYTTRSPFYIPFAEPWVSQLLGASLDALDGTIPDCIYTYYLEPYAVAGMLLSLRLDCPLIIRHAGSDLARLLNGDGTQPQTYRSALTYAHGIQASKSSYQQLWRLGVSPSVTGPLPPASLGDYFSGPHDPIQPEQILGVLPAGVPSQIHLHAERSSFSTSRPTIGTYGKLGQTKGTFDLVETFLKSQLDANIVIMGQGNLHPMEKMARDLSTSERGRDVTWLPFLPPWQVPSFIDSCTAIAFLERDFAVTAHMPKVPWEILARGVKLVVSNEIWAKMTKAAPKVKDSLGTRVWAVDPRDHGALDAVLRLALEAPARTFTPDAGPLASIEEIAEMLMNDIEEAIGTHRQEQMIRLQRDLLRFYADPGSHGSSIRPSDPVGIRSATG